MKYAAFALALLLGVPLMVLVAATWARARSWLLSLLLVSPALGTFTKLNFLSMEYYRGPDRGLEVTLTDLVALALAAALMVRLPRRVRWLPANSGWLLLLFAWSAYTVYQAPAPIFGWFTLAKLARMYLLYWCVANSLRAGVELRSVWRGLVGLSLLLLAWVLLQRYVTHDLTDGFRARGPFDHSNTLPPYLDPVFPVLVVWTVAEASRAWWRRWLALLAVFGMLFAVYSTFSRAGLALAVGALVLALGFALLRAPSVRGALVAGVFGLALLLGGVVAAPRVIERIRTAPESSEQAREEFNYASALMVRDHPLGIGLNNYSHVLTNTPQYRDHITVMADEEQAGVCHHIYWLTLAELGYPGFILFMLILARFLWLATRGAWRGRSLEALLLGGYAIGFLCLHLAGLLEWAFRITPVMAQFAMAAGAVAALEERVRTGTTEEPSGPAPAPEAA
jgi:O-antigen ligase